MKIRSINGAGLFAVTLAVALLVGSTATATTASPGDPGSKPKAYPALATSLRVAAEAAQGAAQGSGNAGALTEVLIVSLDPQATVSELEALGVEDPLVLDTTVVAEVPTASLLALSQSTSISSINPAPMAQTSVIGEPVGVTRADEWQAAGANGQGVVIGIIDLGFQHLATRISQGEVPNSPMVNLCTNINSEPHGTAVAEVVHETAPLAQLIYYCVDSLNDLYQAVQHAKLNGVDVINHSVGWVTADSPGNGTGPLHTIVDDAHDAGILWVNSAGNDALSHYGGYTNTAGGATGTWHRWNGSDPGLTMTLAPGQSISVFLRWDEYYGGNTDLDLYLFPNAGGDAVAVSVDDQSAGGMLPYEQINFTNGGSAVTYDLAIWKFSGAAAPFLDVMIWGLGGNQMPIEFNSTAGSLLEPATSPSVLTVGATNWADGKVRNYSSEGPTKDGRIKPEIYAPDGGQNVTYGSFTGTSSSSPTVAGLAALWLSSSYSADKLPTEFADIVADEFSVPHTGYTAPKTTGSGAPVASMRGATVFTDVSMQHQFLPAIMWMNEQGISQGYSDDTFRPSAAVTRQAMAAFMYRFADPAGYSAPGVSPFTDMNTGSSFYLEASWMAHAGISTGYSDGSFRPGLPVSRSAMAAFMYRLAGSPAYPVPGVSPFSDVPTDSQFYTAIAWMHYTGISTGFVDGTYRPAATVSRQAMSSFMFRMSEL
jgi:hypothetical protein